MCLVVDANVANLILRSKPKECFALIHHWLFIGPGCLVLGGKLAKELCHSNDTRLLITVLNQCGRARTIPSVELVDTQDRVSKTCKSNDPHVLAVAIVGKARLLCSDDGPLRADFKNPAFISNPKGGLYPLKKISKWRHQLIVGLHGCNSKCSLCGQKSSRKQLSF